MHEGVFLSTLPTAPALAAEVVESSIAQCRTTTGANMAIRALERRIATLERQKEELRARIQDKETEQHKCRVAIEALGGPSAHAGSPGG